MKYVGQISRYYILWNFFWGLKKENSQKTAGDEISRMRMHQCQPTILLFFANCKNFARIGGKILR